MTHEPAISVVMPLYNKEREVARAIRSALAQTFIDFELIVVNDGSTDRSVEAVTAFNDSRIRLVEQVNLGVSAARNRGVTEARAELVAFLDADDEWLPEFLSTIMRLHSTFGECGVYATSYYIVCGGQPEQRAILRGIPEGLREGVLEEYFTVATQSDPPVWSSAVALRKEILLDIGGFPVGVIAGEDLLTWARLVTRTDVAYSRTLLARFYAPVAMTDRPPRIPQHPDLVGQGLVALLKNASSDRCKGLRGYLGLWHRMRAVVFLKLNRGTDAREEMRKSALFAGRSLRMLIFKSISYLPGDLPSKAFLSFAKLLAYLRAFAARRVG